MEEILPLVYDELRRMAARRLRDERTSHTLSATALVHETWLELSKLNRIKWQNRSHYLAVAAQAMRRILIDYAIARSRQKRGGGQALVPLDDDVWAIAETRGEELLALDEALVRLGAMNARQARIVECRFLWRDERRGNRGIARHLAGDRQAGVGDRARLVESRAAVMTDPLDTREAMRPIAGSASRTCWPTQSTVLPSSAPRSSKRDAPTICRSDTRWNRC